MKIAVLFDGAGLARLGLEQAGHECTGFELNPDKHRLSLLVGSGNCILADATEVNLDSFDGVWASPPCSAHSGLHMVNVLYKYQHDYLEWCLSLKSKINPLWIENVYDRTNYNWWGKLYNAGQFLKVPVQNRVRMIGGNYIKPKVYHSYIRKFQGTIPCITASEYKGGKTDRQRASGVLGRRLTIEECAYYQGFIVPKEWYIKPDNFTPAEWRNNLYEAIGNGVPVYMAKAFGDVYV